MNFINGRREEEGTSDSDRPVTSPLKIVYFTWSDWDALWMILNYQYNENGILGPIDDIPPRGLEVGRDGYDWDLHHLEEIYLSEGEIRMRLDI